MTSALVCRVPGRRRVDVETAPPFPRLENLRPRGRAALHKHGVHIAPFREQDGVPTSFRALLLDPFCVLHFEIAPLYPFTAPRVMVLTPVEHPVVAGSWLLPALAVLGEDWSPALDVSTLAVVIRSVLVEPKHAEWQTCVGFSDAVLPRGSEAEREVVFDLLLLELDAGELRYRAENGRSLGVLNRLGPLLQ